MKKFFGITVLFFWSITSAQAKINFREGSIAEILKVAQEERKPVMLMGYATWCAHCNTMKSTTLIDQAVADFYNKNFVCAWQDAEKPDGIEMRRRYNVKAFPSFLFLDQKGELLYFGSGEFKAEDFIKLGQQALVPENQLPTLKTKFLADVTNADACLDYIAALRKSNQGTEPAAQKYLSRLADEELISNQNWKIIANGVRDITSREFQYVLRKQPEFAAVSSQKRVERKIVNAVQEWLQPALESNDTVAYFKKRVPAAKIKMFKTDSLIFNADLQILERTKNWKRYHETAANGIERFAWKQAWQLREIARVHMNNILDQKALEKAIVWGKRSIEINDAYDTRIIVARLYLLRNDLKNAKEWAENAKTMAESYNFDTQQAVDILNKIKL